MSAIPVESDHSSYNRPKSDNVISETVQTEAPCRTTREKSGHRPGLLNNRHNIKHFFTSYKESIRYNAGAGIAQSVERLATGWTVQGSNPG